ncbi:class I SAM-dependent methyltransferase [Catenuloplanes atrovinosus]|uniref:S-adenosyl-L-methionine-dependent methyltransferase n=1 Tax=Catenuloplanes atrovinosus TaxID=137266 RepID=A0AAE3YPR4_9ACTN|nr:class I SAM-dependent methyltransferase [Catenuloplanes atrovinosus]MDR7277594.1 methyltransferase (TIGR00027 family) [Catenuloplanes atrovinosus]
MAPRNPATQTAYGPMVVAAAEHARPPGQRLYDDPLAVRMLPTAQRWIARSCRWDAVYRMLVAATDARAHGLWAGVLCRKRYATDQIRAALDAGIRQYVILGAGLDTSPYRLITPAGAHAWELDLPANIAVKRQRTRALPAGLVAGTTLVPIDFATDDLTGTLRAAGFAPAEPAMFVWEAVTQYLTEDAVLGTLAFLGTAAPGSRLIFTYLRADYLDGTSDYDAAPARRDFVDRQHIWRFGLDPAEITTLLRPYGWIVREHVGAQEYTSRYLAPTGRDLPVSGIERFVLAERQDATAGDSR